MVSKSQLLEALPHYKDEWVLINPEQSVQDIVHEVLQAHDEFAQYYDSIATYFDNDSIKKIAADLYTFCKKNLKYNEEPESFQSTSVPQGLLYRGECDCKGYSNFIGGILDGLNRMGRNIKWNYRFASYDLLNKAPHHVFIVANDENGQEIWIDPTPGAQQLQPVWKADKKISAMTRQTTNTIGSAAIGIDSLVVTPVVNNRKLIDHDGTGHYDGALMTQGNDPFISLSQYRDYGGNRIINEWSVADQINALLRQYGKTHTTDGNFVKWVYDNNLRHWNFFYPWGVPIGWTAKNILPDNYPKLIITDDGRLNFDRWAELDDYRNAEIHLMNAWAQSIINQFLKTPFPLKPADLKGFSQGNDGGEDTRNLFLEHRGDSIFSEIGHWINDAFNWVKDGFLEITGAIPRKFFLTAIDLNIFHWAENLYNRIQAGEWDKISTMWEDLGGDRNRLWEIIHKGYTKPAIENDQQQVEATIGEPVSVAAIITAATPIIVAMLQFLNKDGKLDPYLQTLQVGLETAFPDQDWEFLNGTLYSNGQPVTFTPQTSDVPGSPNYVPPSGGGIEAWIKNNPLAAAAIVGVGTAYFTRKPGQQKLNYAWGAIGAGAVYLFAKSKSSTTQTQYPTTTTASLTSAQKLDQLINWANRNTTDSVESIQRAIDIFRDLTATELNAVYDYVFNYLLKGKTVAEGSTLYYQMVAISEKYEIFT